MKRFLIHIAGIVQGVGMRPFVYRTAVAAGVAGSVLNAGDGVHIEAFGPESLVSSFIDTLRENAPAAARIDGIEVRDLGEAGAGPAGFEIRTSSDDGAHTTLVSPDIATCPDCLRELFDPADRRYHYPFINCTNCGPRFTIIRDLPYDRANTSMGAFPMCPSCEREYADPLNRRFHAQPDACFACGPHITWREPGGAEGMLRVGSTREESDAIIARCAELLAGGGIVAIKGLGGFHIACDAGNEAAVRELRRRKRRSNKPLAVMVRTLEDALGLCEVDGTERSLLEGTVRPIVLLRRKRAAGGGAPAGMPAGSVAFDLPELGVMLPYTPLQHLLMAACRDAGVFTLVMTSGNISEEPIETDDALAWGHLVEAGVADALLGNDRAILSRYDDSVVRVVDGELQMVRRARGHAPRPLPLPSTASGTAGLPSILACGSEQKATLALTREAGDGTAECFLSQHIGDVGNGATFDAWHGARKRLEQLFDLHPTALACDLHPGYLPSQWARGEAPSKGLPLFEVQHHHAHIASVIAEAAARGDHDPARPVIGIAFDGTGAGGRTGAKGGLEPDGTVWGGEFLVCDLVEARRAAHLAPWALPGGAVSVRDPRRNAFSLLKSCSLLGHPGARPLIESLTGEERSITATMIERNINCPLTSSMGRFLDAVAAILGVCRAATYEGEPAIALEAAAQQTTPSVPSADETKLASFARNVQPASGAAPARRLSDDMPASKRLDRPAEGQPTVIDPSTLLGRLLEGVAADEPAPDLAMLAHDAVVNMAVARACDIARATGIRTVALSGGVFMNRILLSGICRGLKERGLEVLVAHDIPVNDGCIAYGQAAIARARLAARPEFV